MKKKILKETRFTRESLPDPVDLKYYIDNDFDNNEIKNWEKQSIATDSPFGNGIPLAPKAIQEYAKTLKNELIDSRTESVFDFGDENKYVEIVILPKRGVFRADGPFSEKTVWMKIDKDEDLDWHLQKLYDMVIEKWPDLLNDESQSFQESLMKKWSKRYIKSMN